MLGNLWEIVRSTKNRSDYAVRGSGWGFGAEAIADATKPVPDEWPEKEFPHDVRGAVGFRCAKKLQ